MVTSQHQVRQQQEMALRAAAAAAKAIRKRDDSSNLNLDTAIYLLLSGTDQPQPI